MPAAGGWRPGTATRWPRSAKEVPDLSLDVSVLAALFDGFLCPSEAARAGLMKVHSESALADADRIFAVLGPPFTADYF